MKRVEYLTIAERRDAHVNMGSLDHYYKAHIQRFDKNGVFRIRNYSGISHHSVKRVYDMQDKLLKGGE